MTHDVHGFFHPNIPFNVNADLYLAQSLLYLLRLEIIEVDTPCVAHGSLLEYPSPR